MGHAGRCPFAGRHKGMLALGYGVVNRAPPRHDRRAEGSQNTSFSASAVGYTIRPDRPPFLAADGDLVAKARDNEPFQEGEGQDQPSVEPPMAGDPGGTAAVSPAVEVTSIFPPIGKLADTS